MPKMYAKTRKKLLLMFAAVEENSERLKKGMTPKERIPLLEAQVQELATIYSILNKLIPSPAH